MVGSATSFRVYSSVSIAVGPSGHRPGPQSLCALCFFRRYSLPSVIVRCLFANFVYWCLTVPALPRGSFPQREDFVSLFTDLSQVLREMPGVAQVPVGHSGNETMGF